MNNSTKTFEDYLREAIKEVPNGDRCIPGEKYWHRLAFINMLNDQAKKIEALEKKLKLTEGDVYVDMSDKIQELEKKLQISEEHNGIIINALQEKIDYDKFLKSKW
jgi:hypothetical protein